MNIDNLEVSIRAQATTANKALSDLQKKLLEVSGTMAHVNGNGLNSMAAGIKTLADAVNRIKGIDSRSFTALAKNIDKLSNVNSAGLVNSANAISSMSTALSSLNGMGANIANLDSLSNAIKHLGYKSVDAAINNMPRLATAMNNLMASLSKAPTVSNNLIDMTNALASLTANGHKFTKDSLGINNSFGRLVKGASNTSKSFKSLAYYFGKFYANYFLLVRAFSKLKNSIDISSSLIEVQNVVSMTFGQMSNKVEDFSKISISSFGMSELSAKQFASRFQAMGSAMGIPLEGIGKKFDFINTKIDGMNDSVKNLYSATDGMTDMSLNLTKLAGDMASFYNVSQEDVAKDLESVFTGMTRPLRTYGLDLTQATLQEWALKQGMDVNIKSMTQAQKTMLRYQYVMANADAAMGDFAKTSGTWANQTRMLAENIKALGAVWGTAFINLLKPLITTLNQAMISITNFSVGVINALGQIFGWKIEIQNVGISQDFETADDALEDATGNAKKLKQQLMGIDELNILSDTNSGADGIDMSAGADLNQKKFDIVETESAFKSAIDSVGKLGEYLSEKLNSILSDIDWDSIYEKSANFGTGLASFLNGLITPKLFGSVGSTIASALNTAICEALAFGKSFDWKNLGNSLSSGLNKVFSTFNFQQLSETIVIWVNGLLDTLIAFTENANWSYYGYKIGQFLSSIDFKSILSKVGKLIWEAINAGIDGFSNLFVTAPVETVILSAFMALKFTNLGPLVCGKIKDVLLLAINNPTFWKITIPLTIAIGLKKLDDALLQKQLNEYKDEQIVKFGKTLEEIYNNALSGAEAINQFNKSVREQIEFKDESILFLDNLFNKYIELKNGINLTAGEQALLNQYEQDLIKYLPQLKDYYNEETKSLDITTDSIKKLIEQKEKEIRLNAITENWTETLKQEAKVQMEVKRNVDNLAKAQADLEYWTNICNEALSKDPQANLSQYQDDVMKAYQEVQVFTEALNENKTSLDNISEQTNYYEEMYKQISSGASEAAEKATTFGADIANNTASGINDNAYLTTDAIDNLINNATDKLKTISGDQFEDLGEDIVAGISEPIQNAEMEEPVKGLFGRLIDWCRNIFDWHSPAKSMNPLGEDILLGIVEGFDNKVSEFNTAIEVWFNQSVKPWFTTKKWDDLFDNVKKAAKLKSDELKKWWNELIVNKFWNTRIVPKFTKDYWLLKFDTIQQGAKAKWDEIKKWYLDNVTNKFWNDKIIKIFTKEYWADKFGSIKDGAIQKWDDLKIWWQQTVVEKFLNQTLKPKFTSTYWEEQFAGIKDGFVQTIKNAINIGVNKINAFIDWLNDKFNFSWDGLTIAGKEIYPSGEVKLVNIPHIPQFAMGGFPEDGLFMANHSELVGSFSNGQTAVANNTQIVSGIAYGVREAVKEELAPYLDKLVTSNDTIARKDLSVNIGDKEIARANIRGTKQMGVQIITA